MTISPPMHTVPNYLRTKLDLDLEGRQRRAVGEAREKEAGLKEEITTYNNIISSCQKIVSEAREEMEEQKTRAGKSVLNRGVLIRVCPNQVRCRRQVLPRQKSWLLLISMVTDSHH